MRLEYFGAHGRAIPIRMILHYTNTEYEDKHYTFEEYMGPNSPKPNLTWGQMPVVYLDDGTQIAQTKSICRYLAKVYKGKEGETLYPAHDDPMLSYEIDAIMDELDDLLPKYFPFLSSISPEYKNKDEHFVNFITKFFPEYLAKTEARFEKYGHKFLLADHMTLGDISVAGLLLKTVYNDNYENCHILQAVISKDKYPKTYQWCQMITQIFKSFQEKTVQAPM